MANRRIGTANNANIDENLGSIDGHDEVFDPAVEDADYICLTCSLVLRHPVTTPCGHRFCMQCINGHIATNGLTCPTDGEELEKDQLTAGPKNECPKAQVVCEFKTFGCSWKGVHLQNHLTSSMEAHLSMMCSALTAFLEELNRQLNRYAECIATLETKIEQIEREYDRDLTGIEAYQREFKTSLSALKNGLIELESRSSNGVYLWRITGYTLLLESARNNIVEALHSPPFYTSFYGYKLCLRINPNGVDTGYGSHVSLFVHMMQSDWDDAIEWPFYGKISLSILGQDDDGQYEDSISDTLVARPNLRAFQRPTTPRNRIGYGFPKFARIETTQDSRYLVNDCLLVRVKVSQLFASQESMTNRFN